MQAGCQGESIDIPSQFIAGSQFSDTLPSSELEAGLQPRLTPSSDAWTVLSRPVFSVYVFRNRKLLHNQPVQLLHREEPIPCSADPVVNLPRFLVASGVSL